MAIRENNAARLSASRQGRQGASLRSSGRSAVSGSVTARGNPAPSPMRAAPSGFHSARGPSTAAKGQATLRTNPGYEAVARRGGMSIGAGFSPARGETTTSARNSLPNKAAARAEVSGRRKGAEVQPGLLVASRADHKFDMLNTLPQPSAGLPDLDAMQVRGQRPASVRSSASGRPGTAASAGAASSVRSGKSDDLEAQLDEEARKTLSKTRQAVRFTQSGRAKALITDLKHDIVVDPEPDVVGGIIDDVLIRREARAAAERRRKLQEDQRVELERQAKLHAEQRKAVEAEEAAFHEEMLRTTEQQNAREAADKAEIMRKEADVRAWRQAQMEENKKRQMQERAERMEYERAMLRDISRAAHEERVFDRAQVVEKRAALREAVDANDRAIRKKRDDVEARRREDRQMMDDYNRRVEEQHAAYVEGLEKMHARHKQLGEVADRRRAQEAEARAAENARARREFEAMMDRVRREEADEAAARAAARAEMRATLDAQVAEKRTRSAVEIAASEEAARVAKALAEQAKVEEKAEREKVRGRRLWLQRQLDKQIAANDRMAERDALRQKQYAAAQLAEVADDDSVLAEVRAELDRRGRGRHAEGMVLTAKASRRAAAEQNQWVG